MLSDDMRSVFFLPKVSDEARTPSLTALGHHFSGFLATSLRQKRNKEHVNQEGKSSLFVDDSIISKENPPKPTEKLINES